MSKKPGQGLWSMKRKDKQNTGAFVQWETWQHISVKHDKMFTYYRECYGSTKEGEIISSLLALAEELEFNMNLERVHLGVGRQQGRLTWLGQLQREGTV